MRSILNVGAILRTCEGLGVSNFIATGTTPYPGATDKHLPHVVARIDRQIAKTALGAEKNIHVKSGEINNVITNLRDDGYEIYALEQSAKSMSLRDFKPSANTKIALVVGNETDGIEGEVLQSCDQILEIPMRGQKESFNVASAAAICLWQLTN